MKLTNRTYDVLKFVALVLLPGLGAAYFGLAQIWHLPNAEQVVGSTTVLDTFLGLLLKSSSTKYQELEQTPDGDLIITDDPDDGQRYMSTAWDSRSFKDLDDKKTVILNVVQNPAPKNVKDAE